MDSKDVVRSREQEIQQNGEEIPATELVASVMKSIMCTGDLMAMTKLLSQKLDEDDNKDLLLSQIGRVEKMMMNTINIVNSYDCLDLAPVNKMLRNKQDIQVLLNKIKANLHKVNAADGGNKVNNSPIYLSILNLLCPCVRCHGV